MRVGMSGALISIGKRNKKLNAASIKVAKAIGPNRLQRRRREVRAEWTSSNPKRRSQKESEAATFPLFGLIF